VSTGNPQQLQQKPITFFRQVLSCMEYPALLDHPAAGQIYPQDVLQRARHLLANFSGGTGAYSHSKGERIVREHVAGFLQKRDGYAAEPEVRHWWLLLVGGWLLHCNKFNVVVRRL
jgi:aspartate/methionine/tyrosine aminotransferase